jgi:hypothetical protein
VVRIFDSLAAYVEASVSITLNSSENVDIELETEILKNTV